MAALREARATTEDTAIQGDREPFLLRPLFDREIKMHTESSKGAKGDDSLKFGTSSRHKASMLREWLR